jgi:integrase
VSRSEVKLLLRSIVETHRTTSNRVLELVRVAYAWAMDEDPPLLEVSPCAGLKKLREKARERVLSDDEIRRVWRACVSEGAAGAVLKFLLLSGQRPGEVLGMKPSELDLGARLWRIPSDRMKGGRPHVLPLSQAMLRVLEAVQFGESYVFESGRRAGEPLATLQHALHSIQAATGVIFQVRDLRRTVRSGLSAVGVPQEIAERILAHALPGLVRIYDRHVPLIPMRDALERWAGHLEAIVADEVAFGMRDESGGARA